MEEPSVLDYIKEKLKFWKESSIRIPPPDEGGEEPSFSSPSAGAGEAVRQVQPGNQAQEASREPRRGFPIALVLVLASLALVFIAQGLLEPPNRAWKWSLLVYGAAAVLVGTAYFYGKAVSVQAPEEVESEPDFTFHLAGLVAGLVFMALTFLAFGSKPPDVPEFRLVNTVVWGLSTGYLAWAFWAPRQGQAGLSLRQRLARLAAARSWKITLTRWGLLLLAAAGVVLFFRFYRLGSVPAEMVSDHAEKLLDVNDVLNGQLRVFFPRNTGREAFQFYLTALVATVFHTGISFMSLKLGTVICGLITLLYIYRLGDEIGNRRVALFAFLFAGISYWANIQSRIGLRFPLYPFFLAPTLFYFIRGLRRMRRNDFVFTGIWLGLGLHGYTSDRIVPLVILAGVAIYLLHQRSRDRRWSAVWGLAIIALVSLAIFMPLLRLAIDQPDLLFYRSLTRMADLEQPLPGPAWQIFLSNTWKALVMFFWEDGAVWVHSIPYRPALDVISAGIFFIGLVVVVLRYIHRRNWVDLFLLVSIPLLLLPSILSLAFPNENPNLNRTAGAYVPVFIILAVGLEWALSAVKRSLPPRAGTVLAGCLGLLLATASASNNYNLLFVQFDDQFRANAWNTSQMGQVVGDFSRSLGEVDHAWVVAYPYWVDTRLVGINAGYPTRDTAIAPEKLDTTLDLPQAKLFLLHIQDETSLARLQELYPEGRYWIQPSPVPTKEFIVFLVPPRENLLPRRLPGVTE